MSSACVAFAHVADRRRLRSVALQRTRHHHRQGYRTHARSPDVSARQHLELAASATTAALLAVLAAEPARGVTLHAEPSNALSLPTWAIHVSSVAEWCAAVIGVQVTAGVWDRQGPFHAQGGCNQASIWFLST
jgi:Protein of unknown function (DUF2499)